MEDLKRFWNIWDKKHMNAVLVRDFEMIEKCIKEKNNIDKKIEEKINN